MARTKQRGKGKPYASKQLRKKLTTKRNSLGNKDLPHYSSSNVGKSTASSSSLPPNSTRVSSASLNESRLSALRSSIGKKSLSHSNSIEKDSRTSTRQSLRSIGNESKNTSGSPSSQNFTLDTSIPKGHARKSMHPSPNLNASNLEIQRGYARKSMTDPSTSSSTSKRYSPPNLDITPGYARKSMTYGSRSPSIDRSEDTGNREKNLKAMKKRVSRVYVARKLTRRRRHGVLALQEIRHYQQRTDLLLRKYPFQRLIKELLHGVRNDLYIRKDAISALQEAAEMYLVDLFERSLLCAIHDKRVTLLVKDIMLVKTLNPNLN